MFIVWKVLCENPYFMTDNPLDILEGNRLRITVHLLNDGEAVLYCF